VRPSDHDGVRRRSLRAALAALRALLRDPTDTAQGFRLLEALDPHIHHRELARMQREPSGQQLLRTQPVILDALCARDVLDALPEASLGRAYRAYCEREGLEPEDFVALARTASQADELEDALVRYAAHRHRDSHDLWHVVGGYRTDLAGEAGVLGFTLAQTRSPGLLLLFFGGLLHSLTLAPRHGHTMRRLAFHGLRSGWRARPLSAAPWEDWLARSLDEVRAELGIEDVPSYEPAYAARSGVRA
jgi:ubiquinone biosynthesis protein COQ4